VELGRPELLVPLPRGGGERHGVGEHAHHEHGEAVHVEGERGRRAALRDLFGDEAVGLVVRAEPPEPDRDAEAEEPRRPQVGVIVEGERGLAIVALRTWGEARPREVAGALDQLALAGGGKEVHGL
jgi:hypothetical protein